MYTKKFKLLSDNQLLSVRGGGTPLKTGIIDKPPPVKPPETGRGTGDLFDP
jgi:hypothetical protein